MPVPRAMPWAGRTKGLRPRNAPRFTEQNWHTSDPLRSTIPGRVCPGQACSPTRRHADPPLRSVTGYDRWPSVTGYEPRLSVAAWHAPSQRRVRRHCSPCIAFAARVGIAAWRRKSMGPTAQPLHGGTVGPLGRSSVLTVPVPRAMRSLCYTSRVRPRPACPAGERGWKATTETDAHPDPVRLVRTVNEIRQLAHDRQSSSPT